MDTLTAESIEAELLALADETIAAHSQRFFKTGPGQYGEGDRFLGIRVPLLRSCARKYRTTHNEDVLKLLISPFHETRLLALFILAEQFRRGDERQREGIYNHYLAHTEYINNWDLVDSSAHLIVGPYLEGRDRKMLTHLARSDNLWERRIAILSTLHFIRGNSFADTLQLAELLLNDYHDLIHKAVGWMLREVGKRDKKVLIRFLNNHYRDMPRTMLRYAIEQFEDRERQSYLRGSV